MSILVEEDRIYMCHCSNQISKLPQLETYIWIYLKLLSLLFTDWAEVFSLH